MKHPCGEVSNITNESQQPILAGGPAVLEKEEKSLDTWYLQSRHEFVARTAIATGKISGASSPCISYRSLGEADVPATPDQGAPAATVRVLDAGCGIGGISKELRRRGIFVTGCDKNPDAIEQAIKQNRIDESCAADVCALPYPDNTFDLVICSEVLEHVPDDRRALRELLRVSKGPVFITVPAHRYLWTESDRLLEHQRRYSRHDLTGLLHDSGVQFSKINAFGALPGIMLLGYRLISQAFGHSGGQPADNPLAIRFRLPRWVDRCFYLLSRAELALGRYGLIPWGHAWWTVVWKSSEK